MKKLVFITLLLITVTTISFAQEAKTTPKAITNYSSDLAEITKVANLSVEQQNTYTVLMNMRTEGIANATSTEQKKNMYQAISSKFFGCLSQEQLESLKANTALYKRLTEYSGN